MSTHLRGRVVLREVFPYAGRKVRVWEWRVINTVTGKVIHRDNSGCSLADACDHARRNTDLARDVWRMGIDSGDLLTGREVDEW